jgi:hypothetical protein
VVFVTEDLYPKLLERDWDALPVVMRDLHTPKPLLRAEGLFTVTHSRSFLARMLIFLTRLPPKGQRMPLRLEVDALADQQRWQRTFDERRTMTTYQYLLPDGRLGERTGPLELLFRVEVEKGVVRYHQVGLRLRLGPLRIPLPSWCGPRVSARLWAYPDATEMNVEVRIAVPILGEIVTYGGPLGLTVA